MLALFNIVNDISSRQACLIMCRNGVKNLGYLEVEIEDCGLETSLVYILRVSCRKVIQKNTYRNQSFCFGLIHLSCSEQLRVKDQQEVYISRVGSEKYKTRKGFSFFDFFFFLLYLCSLLKLVDKGNLCQSTSTLKALKKQNPQARHDKEH